MKRKTKNIKRGFSLVELLATLVIIGVLLGLLVPALNQVQKTAIKVKQKAQFHSIGTALEAFRSDYGDYPPSAWDIDGDNVPDYGRYSASQRLAEALIGRDGLGFHPDSLFHETGLDNNGMSLYQNHSNFGADYATPSDKADNLAARNGPYLELENANAINLVNLPSGIHGLPFTAPSYVLVDMYKINKNTATSKEVGMPILYYKANKLRTGYSTMPYWHGNTYNLNDSYCWDSSGLGFIAIGGHYNGDVISNAELFYSTIQNPNFTNPPRPYRAESFLLHSAGPDGLYGTSDDIFNFVQDN